MRREKTTTTISGGDNMPDVLCIINDIMRSQIVQDAGEAGMFLGFDRLFR